MTTAAAHLIGTRVALSGGNMFASQRQASAANVIPLGPEVSTAQGAALFINPMATLSFAEAARRGGQKAIVNTAAASALGQMLERICQADGIPLVNIARSAAAAEVLRKIGARHVLVSTAPDVREQLIDALVETGATVAFDAIGGGTLGGEIIEAMELAAIRASGSFSLYGSTAFKQLYLYGTLDESPYRHNHMGFGFKWNVAPFLVTHALQEFGMEVISAFRERILAERETTFATSYSRVISLEQMLDIDVFRSFERRSTGEKYLVDPTL